MKKKIVFSVFAFVFLSGIGFSQIQFGARVSGSMTNITEVHSWSKARGGFQLAVMARIPVTGNDILFFEPEVNFSTQGEFDQPVITDDFGQIKHEKQKVFMTFINIPLNFKLYFTDSDDEFFALGGPYLGIMVNKNIESKPYPTEAGRNKFNSFDFGASLGFGYSIGRQLEFSLRYSYGLADMVSNDYAKKTNSTSILNLGVAYVFE